LGFWLFGTKEESASVSDISWTYTINLQQRTLRHGSDWEPIRSDAFNVSCDRRYYGDRDCNPHNCRPHQVSYSCNCRSEQCNCHTTCRDQGNGFSRCSESCSTCSKCETCYRTEYDTCYDSCPVYKDHCDYDYYDWPTINTKVTSGAAHNETWPVLEARPIDQRLVKTEKYEVVFKNGVENWKYTPKSLGEFRYFVTGVTWKLKVNRAGMVWPQEAQKEM